MERIMGVLLAAFVLLGSVAYALPPMMQATTTTAVKTPLARATVDVNADTNGAVVAVRTTMGAPRATISGDVRARITTALRRMAPNADIERYIQNAAARRAEVQKIIARARAIREKHVIVSRKYLRVNDVIRQTAQQFRVKEQEWMQIRQQYLAGQVDENTYFEKTKEFLLMAIDMTIERLQTIKENVDDENAVASIDARISELEQLKTEIENAETIEELRAIYPELRAKVQAVQKEAVFRYYAKMTIGFGESITVQLDVAAARLAAIVDELKASGNYDENVDAAVTTIFAKIDAVKDEFNTLSAQLESGEITVQEFMQEISKIREQIREIYKEIKDLYAQLVKMRSQLKVSARTRVRAEVNAPEDRNTVRVEAEVEGNTATSVESIIVEENTTETNTEVTATTTTEINDVEQNIGVEVVTE